MVILLIPSVQQQACACGVCVLVCVWGGAGVFVSLHGALSLLSNCGLFFMSGKLSFCVCT